MQGEQLKQRIDRIEQSADDAKNALKGASLSSDLRQAVLALHQKASGLKHACEGQESASADSVRKDVLEVEEAADKALKACRSAGAGVDAQLQQAVQRAHAEASSLKKDLLQAA